MAKQRSLRRRMWALCLPLIGGLLAGGWAWKRTLPTASAHLLFPALYSEFRFPTQDRTLDPAQEMAGELSFWRAPKDWIRNSLLSREAIDFVCRRIEKAHQDSPRLLRTAVLIQDTGGLRVEDGPSGSLRFQVSADTPEDAMILCEEFLSFLKAERDKVAMRRFQLEERGLEQKQKSVEGELEVSELDLIRSLWNLTREDQKKAPPLEQLTQEFGVYKGSVWEYRKLRVREYTGRLRAKCYAPDFVVVDPPALESLGRTSLEAALQGAGLGLILAFPILLWPAKRKRRRRSRE